MDDTIIDIRNVAVIGAGISGVCAAIHLKRAGLHVTVFERSSRAGGVWVYDERTAKDPAYPSTVPSVGDSPEYRSEQNVRHDSPLRDLTSEDYVVDTRKGKDISLSFAPPGPCYIALKNNVSTVEMELTCQTWKTGTGEFVPHHVLADYIHDTAHANGVWDLISFNTRINQVRKDEKQWRIDIAELIPSENGSSVSDREEAFDAIVIATGHYHACNVPAIPGLADWKRRFPDRVRHSKRYRRPDEFRGQNVLLVGAGTSSLDIARDLGGVARSVYQSSRGGKYDTLSHLLPDNAARVSGIERFDIDENSQRSKPNGALPGTITLSSGQKLCDIHHVIVCTGYHVSFPFMRQYHADGVNPEDASDEVLVTNGQQTHNLYKDIWYIPDPTLAFIGVPYHVATFSLFEFQAIAVAAAFTEKVRLPSRQTMRDEYVKRIREKGPGRDFHSLKKPGDEINYVKELVEMVNVDRDMAEGAMAGHSDKWLHAYAIRRKRQLAMLSQARDPAFDQRVLELMGEC